MNHKMPPGQIARKDFPRFGLTPYAERFPRDLTKVELQLGGDAVVDDAAPLTLDGLPRVRQCSDFHCVTTWSCLQLAWSGVRFAEFYRTCVVPRLRDGAEPTWVVLRGQDGYRTVMPLGDLMADDVLLADQLEGGPLSPDHGAPSRLIAPSHYGYKSVKHLARLELWTHQPKLRAAALAFMDHPRARVAFEERGRWIPGWVLRRLYRPLIGKTVLLFQRAAKAHAEKQRAGG
ncbi:MAG: hypothetical protein RLZZ618_2791 [Pseudomonadota bacterium]|jgi:DMSO/TMAO reductase YedYZ molybdopterin-dependent catalytic subunit